MNKTIILLRVTRVSVQGYTGFRARLHGFPCKVTRVSVQGITGFCDGMEMFFVAI